MSNVKQGSSNSYKSKCPVMHGGLPIGITMVA